MKHSPITELNIAEAWHHAAMYGHRVTAIVIPECRMFEFDRAMGEFLCVRGGERTYRGLPVPYYSDKEAESEAKVLRANGETVMYFDDKLSVWRIFYHNYQEKIHPKKGVVKESKPSCAKEERYEKKVGNYSKVR